jgi:transposase
VVQTQTTSGSHSTATSGPRCPGCQERDATIAELRRRLTQTEREAQALRERVGRNAGNSSMPPSANPPDAPKAKPGKKRSGRKRGGQPGHPPANRPLLPPEQLTEPPIACIPHTCEHCAAALSGTDPWPFLHQVIELPPITPEIREYQRHVLCCSRCGESTRGQLPDGVPEGAFGPRLQAFISLCTGCYHLSKRQVEELLSTAYNVPISLGSITRIEQAVSAAIAEPVAEAQTQVRQTDVVHADETPWKQQPNKASLWLAVTSYLAIFMIRDKRDSQSARVLLGTNFSGILVSDRYAAYHWVKRRQLCWAHLRRDWQAMIERGGSSRRIGRRLRELTDEMFRQWRHVRDGTLTHDQFRFRMISLRHEVGALLRQGSGCAQAKTAGTCRDILEHESALWTFMNVAGVEPTNNAAERALRQAVLWRKKSFGTRSAAGSQYVERILTVVASCRLQGRNVLEYLTSACEAALCNESAPTLLPGPSRAWSAKDRPER